MDEIDHPLQERERAGEQTHLAIISDGGLDMAKGKQYPRQALFDPTVTPFCFAGAFICFFAGTRDRTVFNLACGRAERKLNVSAMLAGMADDARSRVLALRFWPRRDRKISRPHSPMRRLSVADAATCAQRAEKNGTSLRLPP